MDKEQNLDELKRGDAQTRNVYLDEILREIRHDMDAVYEPIEERTDRALRRWLFFWHPLIGAAAGYLSASVTAGVLIWGFLSIVHLLVYIWSYASHIRIQLIWLTTYLTKRAAHHLD